MIDLFYPKICCRSVHCRLASENYKFFSRWKTGETIGKIINNLAAVPGCLEISYVDALQNLRDCWIFKIHFRLKPVWPTASRKVRNLVSIFDPTRMHEPASFRNEAMYRCQTVDVEMIDLHVCFPQIWGSFVYSSEKQRLKIFHVKRMWKSC